MRERTTGAICLGPTGNMQGGHWFMSLATGAWIIRHRWTKLPMPVEAIQRVSQLGFSQSMPVTLTSADRHGHELPNCLDDLRDEDLATDSDDDSYVPSDSDDDSTVTDNDDNDDDDDSVQPPAALCPGPHIFHPCPPSPDDSSDSDVSNAGSRPTSPSGVDLNDTFDEVVDDESVDDDIEGPQIYDDEFGSLPSENTGVDGSYVPEIGDTSGVGSDYSDETPGVDAESVASYVEHEPTLYENCQHAEQQGREAVFQDQGRPARAKKPTYDDEYIYLVALMETLPPEDELFSLVTAQMTASKGIKVFGEAGADAIKKELEQLIYCQVMHGVDPKKLTIAQKKAALQYLMFLKEKRSGKIKGRGCANGQKQRIYKSKEETSSPTVSVEALFLTCLIDALKRRHVMVVDIPGAFMHADIDELIHVKLVGDIAKLLLRVDPSYQKFVTYEKNLVEFLVGQHGFVLNPYDRCVVNKQINGKQCTIAWHVDDLKISHVMNDVIEGIYQLLQDQYSRKETPLTVSRGKKHEYLGMTIDYSEDGKVKFTMEDYIADLLKEIPANIQKVPSVTPAANHLFQVNDRSEKLPDAGQETFHHLVAKLLYPCKRTRGDLQTAVSFLTTRVQSPDVHDHKKLGQCLRYLRRTKHYPLVLEADSMNVIQWWVNASYAVHPDMRSHTGATMMIGKGSVYSKSTHQKINTRSSTEAELVGVNDPMSLILWTCHFLEAQGYSVHDNVVWQDNQSAMLLENKAFGSSSKRTCHLEIRYFFVTDNIKRGKMRVAYCPTDDMIADFFTKPLQGSKFRKFCKQVLNLSDADLLHSPAQECVGADESGSPELGTKSVTFSPGEPHDS